MQPRRASAVFLIALTAPAVTAAKPVRPTRCPDGRFRVVGVALVAGGTAPAVDGIVVAGSRVGIDSGCLGVTGVITATRRGTVVRARWARCGSLVKVRLRGRIASPACTTMTGTLKAKHHRPLSFQAVRSVCGDSVVDPGAGEACEADAACGTGRRCHACRCLDSATVTTTTIPTRSVTPSSVCGNGVIEPGEPCDPLASPSGCFVGEECDVVDEACDCAPVPAMIGRTVIASPPPAPDPGALGLPPAPNGGFRVVEAPGLQLTLDPTLVTPITAVGRCIGWIMGCLAPPDRTLDDCTRSAPACQTTQPWLETDRCCPSACFGAYEAMRRTGVAPILALRRTYFDDVSCFPGVRTLLGRE